MGLFLSLPLLAAERETQKQQEKQEEQKIRELEQFKREQLQTKSALPKQVVCLYGTWEGQDQIQVVGVTLGGEEAYRGHFAPNDSIPEVCHDIRYTFEKDFNADAQLVSPCGTLMDASAIIRYSCSEHGLPGLLGLSPLAN